MSQNETNIIEIGKEPSKQDMLVRNLYLYDTIFDAAINADYSESYATSGVYQLINTPKMQEKIKNYAIAHRVMILPRALKLMDRTIDQIESNIKSDDDETKNVGVAQAAKIQPYIKTLLVDAGVSKQDNAHTVQYVHIDNMQQINAQLTE